VEYFEDLRNINHCEFIIMNQKTENGKYVLENQLRTWSELKRQRAAEARQDPQRRNTLSSFLKQSRESPAIPARKWGGCVGGCNHDHEHYPRREQKETVQDLKSASTVPSSISKTTERNDKPLSTVIESPDAVKAEEVSEENEKAEEDLPAEVSKPSYRRLPSYLDHGRDGGGTASGTNTPHESSDVEDYFTTSAANNSNIAKATRRVPARRPTPEDIERWANESGMGAGKQADALGDEPSHDELSDDEIRQAEKEDKGLRGSVY
jgi:hypothetical protein